MLERKLGKVCAAMLVSAIFVACCAINGTVTAQDQMPAPPVIRVPPLQTVWRTITITKRGSVAATQKGTAKRRTPGTNPSAATATARPEKPEYLSGEVNLEVAADQNPVVRIGMAQNGVTIVEFPASDRFFAIHPGNEDLVTVEKSPTKATDHHMVLRAGSSFTPRKNDNEALTTIMAQMRSGIVITLMIYPVEKLVKQAHRCVISYDRDEVVEARQLEGLAVNLGEPERTEADKSSTGLATTLGTNQAGQGSPLLAGVTTLPASSTVGSLLQVKAAAPTSAVEPVVIQLEKDSKKPKSGVGSETAAKDAVRQALKEPKKFKNWSKERHGLSIAALPPVYLRDGVRLVVVAVRNLRSDTMRIVPGHPDIYIETLGDKKKPLLIERVKKLQIETTSINGAIPAGATVYYGVVCESPILGAKQHMKIAVGQSNAADEPAAADLTAKTR